jgi:predicted permease
MASQATLELLYICLSMLGISLLGAGAAWLRLLEAGAAVRALSQYVFHIALPPTVFLFLAQQKFDSVNWDFAAVFFLLRATSAALIAASLPIAKVLFGWQPEASGAPARGRPLVAEFITAYICSTWMSPIVFGVPILEKLYSQRVARSLPVTASVSSMLFQLPFMIIVYEVAASSPQPPPPPATATATATATAAATVAVAAAATEPPRTRLAVAVAALYSLAGNAIIWAALAGLLWSVAEVGTVPDVLLDLCLMLSQSVSPVGMFSVGLFLFEHGLPRKRAVWPRVALYTLLKFAALPLLALGFVELFDLSNTEARAALLIAALPVSVAGFNIASRYAVQPDVVSATIVVTTLLMPPAQVALFALLDAASYRPT